MHCREHVVQLHRKIDLIRGAGAELYVIGNGSPSFIAGFREETGWDGAIYTDPSLATYKAAELKRSMVATLHPRGIGTSIRTLSRGFRQGRSLGDTWQQGGVLVVATGGEVRWHHASDRPGDNATAEQIANALKPAAAA